MSFPTRSLADRIAAEMDEEKRRDLIELESRIFHTNHWVARLNAMRAKLERSRDEILRGRDAQADDNNQQTHIDLHA